MKKTWKCPECFYEFSEDELFPLLTPEEKREGKIKCPMCGYPISFVPKDIVPPPEPTVSYEQLGILVLDGSGSMVTQTKELITKADAVSKSVSEFFEKMKSSRINNHFRFAIVNFDEESHLRMGITKIADVNVRDDFNPVQKRGGLTYLYSGLEEAEKLADKFLTEKEKGTRSVVVVIMTDGMDMDMSKAKNTVERMKSKFGASLKVTASCFGTRDITDTDRGKIMAFLKTIVTEERMCIETSSADELRSFFIASVSR